MLLTLLLMLWRLWLLLILRWWRWQRVFLSIYFSALSQLRFDLTKNLPRLLLLQFQLLLLRTAAAAGS